MQRLVRLCLQKDPSAWEAFVERYSRLVYWAVERSFARHQFSHSQEDSEDVFQQVFSHLWEKGLRKARNIERLDGWLAVVSYRIAVDYMRREGKLRQKLISLEESLDAAQSGLTLEAFLPVAEKGVRELLDEKSLQAALTEILDALSEKESCILRLHLMEEKTHAEISELLKLPIGTVSSVIQRAKAKMGMLLRKRTGEI
ncbi:MAG: sigma-70 family RNA polymerase sigma factor [Candidatus Omnitrophota bacterium]